MLSSTGHLKVLHSHAHGNGYISCDMGEPTPCKEDRPPVGIDVGLNSFAVTSDGQTIVNQRFFRKEEKVLAKAQRKWDAVKKKPKTDAVREKRRKVIARVHERIRNKRHNFAHQESRKMVNRHSFIVAEKLEVQKMQKNRRLSKSIADVAWSLFRHCLEYKAEEAGIGFKAVNPKHTSQDCSACGHREKKALSDRVHHCKACGYTADRDLNAAINILTLGLQRQVACRQEAHSQRALALGVVTIVVNFKRLIYLYSSEIPLVAKKRRG